MKNKMKLSKKHTNFKRSFRSLGSSFSSGFTLIDSVFVAIASVLTFDAIDSLGVCVIMLELKNAELEAVFDIELCVGSDAAVFGTILYFFFFGKSLSDDVFNASLIGLLFSSPLRIRL